MRALTIVNQENNEIVLGPDADYMRLARSVIKHTELLFYSVYANSKNPRLTNKEWDSFQIALHLTQNQI